MIHPTPAADSSDVLLPETFDHLLEQETDEIVLEEDVGVDDDEEDSEDPPGDKSRKQKPPRELEVSVEDPMEEEVDLKRHGDNHHPKQPLFPPMPQHMTPDGVRHGGPMGGPMGSGVPNQHQFGPGYPPAFRLLEVGTFKSTHEYNFVVKMEQQM